MTLDEALVRHLADLAGLPVDKHELPGLVAEMQRLVGWVDEMPASVDPDETEAAGRDPEPAMPLGADEPHQCLDPELVQRMAPRFDSGFVVVPCVLPGPGDHGDSGS
jgi:aspartyl/glutamyl-tRNA(Asn/Gln) amidotransferase C subunit